ncbi:MAG: glycoside hydrolase family 16 protein [Corallococcus sp.]|nr:glycoside hydrolase family 16 protein [Corallococcus sp.]MCM1359584.1 glycoside hydrolase family 16 protein [Corallococcus sp.]MCM1395176.1 glycoside hydrolase family 16 protein [Corallococcus sp.]
MLADNVAFDEDGNLVLIVNGDWYAGDKQGIDVGAQDSLVSGGQRTGAKVQSTQTYGPGSFEVSMKIPSFNGICTSMWLYNNFVGADGRVHNYEIDIEIHGTAVVNGKLLGMDNGSKNIGNLATPLFTTWVTEQSYTSEYKNVGYNLADGNFHTYRIDWHTGNDARVEYYIDGVLVVTQYTNVPTNEMYVNIGCWFPYQWCGEADFETDCAVVKYFTYMPFDGEIADKENCNTLANGGWVADLEIPVKNLIANGNFDYDVTVNDAWSVTDGTALVNNGNLTLDGTLVQNVYLDCLGLTYNLLVEGNGNANVKVIYGSIVDDVVVTGEVAGTLGEPIVLETPQNCTTIQIEIESFGEVTLTDVTLLVAAV